MSIQDDVIDFVADRVGIDPSRISLDTTLNNDLGVDGDDGGEFLLDFSKSFGVDLEPISKVYFGSEGFGLSAFVWPILAFLYAFGWRQKMFDEISPLPIRVLVSSAEAHKWIDS